MRGLAVGAFGAVIPGKVHDGLGEDPVLLGIELPHTPLELVDDVRIRGSWRLDRGVTPLGPTAGVGDGAFLLERHGAGEQEHFGLYLTRIHARTAPEGPGLIVEQVDVYHPVQLAESRPDLAGIGTGASRVLAPGEETFELALEHLIKEHKP